MAAPMVVPAVSGGAGGGHTRAEYRRALADALGEYALLTVSATPSSAVHPDADRQVLVTALSSDGLDTGRFDQAYVYVANGAEAGSVRRVLNGTTDGAIGSLLLDRPFSAPLASGTEVELTAPLPGTRHLTTKGLNQVVDEALARIMVEVLLPITGTGSREYALAAYPWLTDERQIIGIYDAARFGADQPQEPSPYGFRISANGAAGTLVVGPTYSTSETFTLRAMGPADRLVYDGSAWGYAATPGLQADTYRGIPPVHWVVAFGMLRALQHLTSATLRDRRMGADEKAGWLADYGEQRQRWAASALAIKRHLFPKPRPHRTPALVAGTSWHGSVSEGVEDAWR